MEIYDLIATEAKNEPKVLSEDNFALVPYSLLNDIKASKLNFTDIAVYIVFLHHQRGKEMCWPSNNTIAEYLGVGVKTVERSIKRLITAGHLARSGKTKYGTRYTSLKTKVKDSVVIRGEPSQTPIKNNGYLAEERIHPENPAAKEASLGTVEIPSREDAKEIGTKPLMEQAHEPNDDFGDRVDKYIKEFGKGVLTGKDEPEIESETLETEQAPEQEDGYVPF